jgi:hypothetical protein
MNGGESNGTRAVAREWEREWKIEGHFPTRDDSVTKRARAIARGLHWCRPRLCRLRARLDRIVLGRLAVGRLAVGRLAVALPRTAS